MRPGPGRGLGRASKRSPTRSANQARTTHHHCTHAGQQQQLPHSLQCVQLARASTYGSLGGCAMHGLGTSLPTCLPTYAVMANSHCDPPSPPPCALLATAPSTLSPPREGHVTSSQHGRRCHVVTARARCPSTSRRHSTGEGSQQYLCPSSNASSAPVWAPSSPQPP